MKLIKRVVQYYSFYCAGCKHQHTYTVDENGSQWQFNGNIDNPSFTPSLLNREIGIDEKTGEYTVVKSVCHLFITDGKIVYCGDCTHELSGQTVEMQNVG